RRGATAVRPVTVAIDGSGFSLATMGYLNGQPLSTRFVSESRIEVELPGHLATSESGFGQIQAADGPPRTMRVRIGAAELATPAPTVTAKPEVPKAGRQFSLVVGFGVTRPTVASILQLDVTFPNGEEKSGYFRISAREAKAGRKTV